jgi:uncharacterized protein (DUF433 family)
MKWKHLRRRQESSYRQLFIAGTRIKASSVYGSILANNLTLEEAAIEFDLPIEVIEEAVAYSNSQKELIEDEEKRFFLETTVPTIAVR